MEAGPDKKSIWSRYLLPCFHSDKPYVVYTSCEVQMIQMLGLPDVQMGTLLELSFHIVSACFTFQHFVLVPRQLWFLSMTTLPMLAVMILFWNERFWIISFSLFCETGLKFIQKKGWKATDSWFAKSCIESLVRSKERNSAKDHRHPPPPGSDPDVATSGTDRCSSR